MMSHVIGIMRLNFVEIVISYCLLDLKWDVDVTKARGSVNKRSLILSPKHIECMSNMDEKMYWLHPPRRSNSY